MIRVLLVEDQKDFASTFIELVEKTGKVTVTLASSRDSALSQIANNCFDLIVCDLKIPSTEGELDLQEEHGEAVLSQISLVTPGTPVIVLSAFGSIDSAMGIVKHAPRMDVVGDRDDMLMTQFMTKDRLDSCIEEIANFAKRLSATDRLEIRKGADCSLDKAEARAVRIFARSCEGRIIDVDQVIGGLTKTNTYTVRITDAEGKLRGITLAKIGSIEAINDEVTRLTRFVQPTLPPGSFAALLHKVLAGAGTTGAVFYQLAKSFSLFDSLALDQSRSSEIIDRLATNLARWTDSGAQSEITVGELRKIIDPDQGADDIDQSILDAVDSEKVIVKKSIQHGDLHAGNVLLDDDSRPVVIDFGRVGESISGYDAIALELGVLFHPRGKELLSDWPTIDQVLHWDDLEVYLPRCPIPEFVSACRRWARASSPSDKTLIACVYTHALRQMRYKDTNKALARALVDFAHRSLVEA